NTMRAHTAWAMNAMRAHMAWAMNAMRAHTAWAMNAMRTHTSWAWNAVRAHLAATLGAIVRNLWANWNRALGVTRRTWAAIRNTIRQAWAQIQRDTFNSTQRMRVTQRNYQGFMARSWGAISNNIRGNVNAQRGHLASLRTAMHHTRVSMRNTADWAVRQFGRIKKASADPIRWTINVPMNGLIGAWNNINRQFRFRKHVRQMRAGFSSGGYTGDGYRYAPAGVVHRGEYVIRKGIAQKARPFLDALNDGQPEALQATGGARAKMPGYARGGLVANTGGAVNAALLRASNWARKQHNK